MKRLICLLLGFTLLISGCQLASPEGAWEADQLIGVLAGFAWEGAANAQGHAQIFGEDYDQIENLEITEDMAYMGLIFEELENGEQARGAQIQGGLCGSDFQMHVGGDNSETLRLSATLYADRTGGTRILQLFHVYRRSDGSLYAQSAVSGSFGPDGNGGALITSETESGRAGEQSREFQINLEFVYPAQAYTVREMDANNGELRSSRLDRTDFTGEGFACQVSAEAAYVLIEADLGEMGLAWESYNRMQAGEEALHNCHFAGDKNLGGIETLPLRLIF